MLEAGFVRAKNSLNIIMKVFIDCCTGLLGYWAVGFGIMYGLDKFGIFSTTGFFIKGAMSNLTILVQNGLPTEVYWMFQAAFAVDKLCVIIRLYFEKEKGETMDQSDKVSIIKRANIYFDGKVTGRTVLL
jgi:Amt family ammonium transporter